MIYKELPSWRSEFSPMWSPSQFHVALCEKSLFSLTKVMVSHDCLRSTLTSRIAFDRQESESNLKFEHPMDPCCQALASKLQT